MEPKTIKIDNVEYVRRDSIEKEAPLVDGLKCCMIRTYSAGVHFGYLKRHEGKEVELVNSRRIWSWSGACSLSQLAIDGSKDIDNCKIAMKVPSIILTEAIEIIPMSEKSMTNLYGAEVWKK